MPNHDIVTIVGHVTDIFAHRFVVETDRGRILADLTPSGARQVSLNVGDQVTLRGEMKPSELKVAEFTRQGEDAMILVPGEPHGHGPDCDPSVAVRTAERNGYEVVGEPKRRPKHFEVLARNPGGTLEELHVELDGRLRKVVPAR